MSKVSNLFAAGIFIVFLAVLFHYFCRVRKKPEMIVQQHIQVPDGYVYPITANLSNAHTHQLVLAPNFGHYPSMLAASSAPYSVNAGRPYNQTVPGYVPPNQLYSNPAHLNPTEEDLPPPYHVAVARAPNGQ